MPLYIVLPYGIVFLIVFICLKPVYRITLAFFLMTNCFDLLPNQVSGIKLWDAGLLLLFAGSVPLFFKDSRNSLYRPAYMKMYYLFVLVLFASFFYSVYIYRYPKISVIKTSRNMILGYLSFLAFNRLFEADKTALGKFLSILYHLLFLLLSLNLVQYLAGIEIFRGYLGMYGGKYRSIPIFLGFASVFVWRNLTRLLSGKKIGFYDSAYSILYFAGILISYTRGYYLAVSLSLMLMLLVLARDGRIRFSRSILTAFALIIIFTGYIFTPGMEQFTQRATSTFSDIAGAKRKNVERNSISLRYYTLKERVQLVKRKNPLIGFGFIHEEIAKRRVFYRFGTWNKERQYITFISTDIAWVNLVIYTGFLGTSVFIAYILSVFIHHFRISSGTKEDYHTHLACFLGFFTMFFLMVIGNSFSSHVQLQMVTIAAYLHLSRTQVSEIGVCRLVSGVSRAGRPVASSKIMSVHGSLSK